jgi:hypothetical protein
VVFAKTRLHLPAHHLSPLHWVTKNKHSYQRWVNYCMQSLSSMLSLG